VGRPSPSTYTTASADSPTLSMGNAEVGSDAQLVSTVEDFNADVAAVRGPKYAPCVRNGLTKLLQRQLPAGTAVQSATVVRLPIAGSTNPVAPTTTTTAPTTTATTTTIVVP
jgi:hypothetical protein